jgi:hypothetical protein
MNNSKQIKVNLSKIRNVELSWCFSRSVGSRWVSFPVCDRVADVPRINCKDTWASVGDRSVYLQCEVVARPQPSALYWQLGQDANDTADGRAANGRLPQGEHIAGDGYYWTVATVSKWTNERCPDCFHWCMHVWAWAFCEIKIIRRSWRFKFVDPAEKWSSVAQWSLVQYGGFIVGFANLHNRFFFNTHLGASMSITCRHRTPKKRPTVGSCATVVDCCSGRKQLASFIALFWWERFMIKSRVLTEPND